MVWRAYLEPQRLPPSLSLTHPSREFYLRFSPRVTGKFHFMFDFPCIISLYYTKNQQDATLAVLFISNGKITLHVSDAFCVHHQEY